MQLAPVNFKKLGYRPHLFLVRLAQKNPARRIKFDAGLNSNFSER